MYKFPGSDLPYTIILVVMTLPIYGAGGATYALYRNLGLVDSYAHIICSAAGMTGSFLYFRAFFKNMSWTFSSCPARAGFRFSRALLTRRQACFHPSPGKLLFALSLAPLARFHLFPNLWLIPQRTAHRKRNPACGWTKSGLWPVDILTAFGRNLCAAHTNDEAPKPFRFRGFIYPGSYLLSRDLSSDYHRRADVSLPGSEWDRVGPSGYDHQVSGSFSLLCSLLTSVIICACGFLWCFCWLPFSAAG